MYGRCTADVRPMGAVVQKTIDPASDAWKTLRLLTARALPSSGLSGIIFCWKAGERRGARVCVRVRACARNHVPASLALIVCVREDVSRESWPSRAREKERVRGCAGASRRAREGRRSVTLLEVVALGVQEPLAALPGRARGAPLPSCTAHLQEASLSTSFKKGLVRRTSKLGGLG